jgi:gliding-associated putative ABC transporter substrate-binding component GldG
MKSKQSLYSTVGLVAGILILLNVLADRYFVRLDFTEDKRYTLSQATHEILSSLKDPVTVTAYFSEDLPPDIAKTRKDFKELLVEYAASSKGKVVYEFINPNKDEKAEQKANQEGVSPVMVNVRDKDQMKQQKAYLGAVVQLGERREVIPFMQPGAAMEYALSSSIKKLTISARKTIGMLQGHGEAKQSAMNQANALLSVMYSIQDLTLNDTMQIPASINTLAIIDPQDSINEIQLGKIDDFMKRGGNVFIATNTAKAEFQKAMAEIHHTGLEKWLMGKGITIGDELVIDASCGSVQAPRQFGSVQVMQNINFPYLPVLHSFADHPITKGISTVFFQFANPIKYIGNPGVTYTPLVKSSEKSGTQSLPVYFDLGRQWTQKDFPLSGLVVAAALEGNLMGNTKSKMVVVANGNFAVNGESEKANQLQPDNVNLLVNSIDWLSDDTGLIELRTKGVASHPLNQVEDSTKVLLKYFNFLFPIFLIIIYGFIRFQMKRNERMKRAAENYA